jgi:hypothetical protein
MKMNKQRLKKRAKELSEIAENAKKYRKSKYPNLEPDEDLDGYKWDENGIEEKINLLRITILDIYEYLNKNGK